MLEESLLGMVKLNVPTLELRKKPAPIFKCFFTAEVESILKSLIENLITLYTLFHQI